MLEVTLSLSSPRSISRFSCRVQISLSVYVSIHMIHKWSPYLFRHKVVESCGVHLCIYTVSFCTVASNNLDWRQIGQAPLNWCRILSICAYIYMYIYIYLCCNVHSQILLHCIWLSGHGCILYTVEHHGCLNSFTNIQSPKAVFANLPWP